MLWIAGGLFTSIVTLIGVVWKLLRDEAKDQAIQLKEKADANRVHELEGRWQLELNAVREVNEKMVNKLEQRHDREMQQMAERLGEQIRATEANILAQIRIMFETLRKD
jgi:hypothetical protein